MNSWRLPVVPPVAPMLARLTRELPGGDYLFAAGRRSLLFDSAVLRRLDEAGDLFRPVLAPAQDLPPA